MDTNLLTGAPADQRVIRRLNALLVVFILILVAIPTSVWASHQFSDVPDDHTHHASITAVKNAGITGGCNQEGTLYCPQGSVTRGQMAAFLHRSVGRVAQASGDFVSLPSSRALTTVTQLQISVPGVPVPGQFQFVKVDAAFNLLQDAGTGCPCRARFYLYDTTTGQGSQLSGETVPNVPGDYASGAVTTVFGVPAGTTRTFELRGYLDTGSSNGLKAQGLITAITAPFGSTGGNAP